MLKNKKILVLGIILLAIILIIPNTSKAAEELTYKDTAQGIDWTYELDNSGNVVNLRCKTTSKIGAVTIPSKIDGKTVISLGGGYYPKNGAFQNCAGITGVTIPNTIITIKGSAFSGCSGLKSITIPNSVTTIGNGAFYECSGLTSVTLSNKLTSIDNSAFSGCSGLKSITIPNSVTTIGNYAFAYCSGLKELTLSNNLTKIGADTFYACSGLTSFVIPNSVTTIESIAFCGCTNLTKILIPDSVASIANNAFSGCNKLTIYGNDGQVSKQYAEEHKINFDYIANWNKVTSTTDTIPPTVKEINVQYKTVYSYWNSNSKMYEIPNGKKITIDVSFSEEIKGTTVPTLTIKFGDGQNIQVKEGVVSGSVITYVYTIKNTDKGMMTAVSLQGGNITDKAGNAAKLSCPALKAGGDSKDKVYANGTTSAAPSGNTNTGATTGTGSTNNGGTTNTGSTNTSTKAPTTNAGTNNKADGTTAKTKIPQTGQSAMIVMVFAVVIAVGVVAYVKYNKYKEI